MTTAKEIASIPVCRSPMFYLQKRGDGQNKLVTVEFPFFKKKKKRRKKVRIYGFSCPW